MREREWERFQNNGANLLLLLLPLLPRLAPLPTTDRPVIAEEAVAVVIPSHPHARPASRRTRWSDTEFAAQAAARELGLVLRFEGPVADRRWVVLNRPDGAVLGYYEARRRRFEVRGRRGTATAGWKPVLDYAAGRSTNPLTPAPLRVQA